MPTCFPVKNGCRGLSLLLITAGKGFSRPLPPGPCFRAVLWEGGRAGGSDGSMGLLAAAVAAAVASS